LCLLQRHPSYDPAKVAAEVWSLSDPNGLSPKVKPGSIDVATLIVGFLLGIANCRITSGKLTWIVTVLSVVLSLRFASRRMDPGHQEHMDNAQARRSTLLPRLWQKRSDAIAIQSFPVNGVSLNASLLGSVVK